MQGQFDADRKARYAGQARAMIPVVAQDPMAPCALPTPDSWQWFTETGKSRAPAWQNEVTLQSVEMFTEYEPGVYIEWVSPTPLMMVVAAGDHLTVSDEALAAMGLAIVSVAVAFTVDGITRVEIHHEHRSALHDRPHADQELVVLCEDPSLQGL